MGAALTLGAAASGRNAAAASARQSRVHDTFLVVASTWRGPSVARLEILGGDGRLQRLIEKTRLPLGLPEARWSPDGSRLAWVDPRGVVVAKSDGTHRQLVFPNRFDCSKYCSDWFAWSPDGRRLAVSYRDDVRYTSRLVVLTLRPRRVVNLAADLSRARKQTTYLVNGWSRTGWISYVRDVESPIVGPSAELTLVRPDGTRPHTVFTPDPLGGTGFAWSPDGRYIAVTTDERNAALPGLGVINVATGKLHRIRAVPASAIAPVWSPDSKRLAVGNVTLNRDGSGARKLSIGYYPALWSRRTNNLYVVGGMNSRYVYVSPDGAQGGRLLFAMPRHQGASLMDVK